MGQCHRTYMSKQKSGLKRQNVMHPSRSMVQNGVFVISLDFELYWGVRDSRTIEQYGNHIRGVWKVIPRLLDLFDRYNVSATFATVGFLFSENGEDINEFLPDKKPDYADKRISPYLSNNEFEQKHKELHFALPLIQKIKQHPNHEIASHTFSHYYCMEEGQTVSDFRDDMTSAKTIAQKEQVRLQSLVFPRNQWRSGYLEIAKQMGIIAYRGNETAWFQKPKKEEDISLVERFFRISDAYVNISGHNCFHLEKSDEKFPLNIRGSRFLRPHHPRLSFLDPLRKKRIIKSLRHAAKNKTIYHLWWHPHNFGVRQEKNFAFLESILKEFQKLNCQYNFESKTMTALAKEYTPSSIKPEF